MPEREIQERAILQIIEKSSLHEKFPAYSGVYLYLLDGETLVLGPYRGRTTEYTRIPIGAGICGRAARLIKTLNKYYQNSRAREDAHKQFDFSLHPKKPLNLTRPEILL